MPIPASVCPKVSSIERMSDGMSSPVHPMARRVRHATSPAASRAGWLAPVMTSIALTMIWTMRAVGASLRCPRSGR